MMTAGHIALIGAGIVLAACLTVGTNPLAPLVDVVARGKRLNYTTPVGGVVRESAADCAAAASAVLGRPVTEEAIALARMVRSEDGSAGQIAKSYKCHVAFNQAAALNWEIVRLITFHTATSRDGKFGQQITGRFASDEDPYENDLAAAEYAQAQRRQGADPTGGALNFVDKGAFGTQEGTGSFADLVAKWGAEGKIPGTLPDTPRGLVFFWRGNPPAHAEMIA